MLYSVAPPVNDPNHRPAARLMTRQRTGGDVDLLPPTPNPGLDERTPPHPGPLNPAWRSQAKRDQTFNPTTTMMHEIIIPINRTRSPRHLEGVGVEHRVHPLYGLAPAARCPYTDADQVLLGDVANAPAADTVDAGERPDAGPGTPGNQLHGALAVDVGDGGQALRRVGVDVDTVGLSRGQRHGQRRDEQEREPQEHRSQPPRAQTIGGQDRGATKGGWLIHGSRSSAPELLAELADSGKKRNVIDLIFAALDC